MFNLFKKKKEPETPLQEEEENVRVNIFIKYTYEWNEDVPESERDTPEYPSRPFCKKMIELNRVYSRAEIELISQRVGYSVWDRRGGEGCRHRWAKITIVKKIE